MTPEEFRTHGHALVDWIAEYLEGVEQYPVGSQVQPGDIRSMLPEHPPAEAEPFADVLADMDRVVMPGITHCSTRGSSPSSPPTSPMRRSSATWPLRDLECRA